MWEGLAPDGSVSVNTFPSDPPLSGASPPPTLESAVAVIPDAWPSYSMPLNTATTPTPAASPHPPCSTGWSAPPHAPPPPGGHSPPVPARQWSCQQLLAIPVASRLVLRWAAQQPQNQALSRIRYTAFYWIGGASHPNAGQARSPQRLRFAARQRQVEVIKTPTTQFAHSTTPAPSSPPASSPPRSTLVTTRTP